MDISRTIPKGAFAKITGSPLAPNLSGRVYFLPVSGGIRVFVEVSGLPAFSPASATQPNPIGPFGFHLHDSPCEIGDPQNPYMTCGGHYNPTNQPHGNHAGDFPVLIANNGFAEMAFFTNRFNINDIIGKSVVIHQNPDDYRTQPAGNSGKRIGAGNIVALT